MMSKEKDRKKKDEDDWMYELFPEISLRSYGDDDEVFAQAIARSLGLRFLKADEVIPGAG